MKILFSTTFSLLVLSLFAAKAQVTPSVQIAKFKDNKVCAISYTFDDGLKEHYTKVMPWFKKLGLKGTFVVNGSIINQDDRVVDTTRMTWGELKKMAALGQEISNHGWAHKNFGKFSIAEIKEDIQKNDSAIFAHLGIMPRTFAYPNNTKTTEGVKIASANRVGTRLFQRSIGSKSTSSDLDHWVGKLMNERDWGVGMTHGITYGYDHFSSPDILWEHLEKVKVMTDKIWVGTFQEVSAYVNERDQTTLDLKARTDTECNITPNCTLDRSIYNQPLTAFFDAKNIKNAEVKQANKKLKITRQADIMVFDFDPFGGAIELKFKKKK